MTKLILICIAIIALMGLVIYLLIKQNRAEKKQIEELKTNLQSARVNVEQLSKYIDKLLEIKADEKTVSEKIKEAESDEEVFNIIADIVNSNNQRMQDNKG